MRKEKKHIILKLILLAAVIFGIYVALCDIPMVETTVEKIIPNDTFKS